MRALEKARSWLKAERGNVAIMFAIMLPLVVGGAGFGVETAYWYLTRLHLQTAADTAAFAGAMEKRAGSLDPAIVSTATAAATENGFDPSLGVIQVNTPPATGTAGAKAVEVIIDSTASRFFTQVFMDGPVNLKVRAVAKFEEARNACMLALSYTKSKAALFSGSANVSLTACSVMSNSMAADGLVVQGSSKVVTDCVISVGGVQLTSGATITDPKCAGGVSQAAPIPDPFRNIPEPSKPPGCLNEGPAILAPGNYCNGLKFNGDVHLKPGVYYISSGTLSFSAHSKVTGDGVTFFLAPGVRVMMNANANADISAPLTGTYRGMLFFGARSNTTQQSFNGTATSSMTGNIYFPAGEVTYNGSFSGKNGCTQVVADVVNWTGNSNLSANCEGFGMDKITYSIVKLVE